MSLIGVDIGTSGCKAMVLREDGRVLAAGYREYAASRRRPGWLELDPELVIASVFDVLREVAAVPEVRADSPVALAASVSGDEVIPVDADGRVLYPAIMSTDARGCEEAERLDGLIGRARLYRLTGQPLHPKYGLNRILWLRRHEPSVFERTWKFQTWEDFLYLRLGAEPVTDFSAAARLMLFDLNTRSWSPEILRAAQLEEGLLPGTAPSGTAVGRVARAVAEELGLPPGLTIVTGGFDQACAGLGAGASRPGVASVGTGTMESLCLVQARPSDAPDLLRGGYPFTPHVTGNAYVCTATSPAGGSLLKWYRDNFGQGARRVSAETGRDVYDVLLEEALPGPSPVLVIPHFDGSGPPTKDPAAKGAILGLTSGTKAGHILQAILEGTAFELAVNLEFLEERLGPVEVLHAVGGGARSKRWVQIKADVTGKPVRRLKVVEAGCLAAAVLAGVGVGAYDQAATAIDRMVEVLDESRPDRDLHQAYRERLARYREIVPGLMALQRRIGG